MKRFILILSSVFLTVSAVSYAVEQPAKQFGISNFSGGLNTNYDSLTIQDNEVASSLNMLWDVDNSADLRDGFTNSISSSSLSYTGAWSYTDANNSNWVVVLSSDAIRAGVPGGSFTVRVATVPSGGVVNAVVAFNSIWFTDQTQGVYYWNGTSTTYVTGSPRGKFIDTFRNRILVAGLATPNQNQTYLSGFLNGQNWTTGTLSTDAAVISFGLQDNQDSITGTFTGFNDLAVVFKKQSIWALFGFDTTDFQVRTLNREVGCIDQRSIQPFRGGIVFASLRAVEYFDGSNAYPISDKVKNLIDPALNNAFSLKSWSQSSAEDFQAGSFVPTANLSTIISPGNLTVSSFSVTENSSASGWSTGTSSNMAVGISSISLATNNSGTASDPSFESSTGAGPVIFDFSSNWTVITNYSPALWISVKTLSNGAGCTLSPQSGTYYAHASGTSNIFQVIDAAGSTGDSATVLASQAMSQTNDCVWTVYTLSSSGDTGKRVKFQVKNTSSGHANNYIVTTESYIFGGSVSFYGNVSDNAAGHGPGGAGIDNITTGSSTITSGSFTSKMFDTGFTSSTIQISDFQWTVNTTTPTFNLLTATATTGPWTQVLTSSSTNVVSNRYIRYTSTISISGGDVVFTSINSVSLLARSTGTFYSDVHNAPSLSAWDIFSANRVLNDGTISFFIRSFIIYLFKPPAPPPHSTSFTACLSFIRQALSFEIEYTLPI